MASDGQERFLERSITLTDAVVAIAMTLLVLPLVDQVEVVHNAGLSAMVGELGNLFVSFVVSFLVIYVFWSAHERALAMVDVMAPRLRLLNMVWLLLVAFLPFPTALVGREASTTSVPLYIGTMFVLSVVTSAMIETAARTSPHPDVAASRTGWRRTLTWTTPVVFGLCAVVGAVNAGLGLLGLLLLIVVRVAEGVVPRLTGAGAA
ncbi:MAG: TMEM175 family protein [Dermatophilaceae bacterium]